MLTSPPHCQFVEDRGWLDPRMRIKTTKDALQVMTSVQPGPSKEMPFNLEDVDRAVAAKRKGDAFFRTLQAQYDRAFTQLPSTYLAVFKKMFYEVSKTA